MRTEAEIRILGMKALLKELGDVDTEIFIKNMIREPFDYTEWQRTLWNEKTVTEISKEAKKAADSE